MGLIAGFLGKETKHVRAVDGVSFDVQRGEVFCLVGESGCGKTTTGKALIRLNDPTGGNIFFDVPADEWNRLGALEARLATLYPYASALGPQETRQAYADWARVQALADRVESTRHPCAPRRREGAPATGSSRRGTLAAARGARSGGNAS